MENAQILRYLSIFSAWNFYGFIYQRHGVSGNALLSM